jgi:hypothetical protein
MVKGFLSTFSFSLEKKRCRRRQEMIELYNTVLFVFEFSLFAFGTTSFCLDTKGSKKSRSSKELSSGPLGTFRQSPQCQPFGKAFVQLAGASNISIMLRGI